MFFAAKTQDQRSKFAISTTRDFYSEQEVYPIQVGSSFDVRGSDFALVFILLVFVPYILAILFSIKMWDSSYPHISLFCDEPGFDV